MHPIDLNTVIRRAEGFTTAAVGNDLMMLDIQQDAYYSLDPIAAEIWTILEQPARVQDVVDRMQTRYAVSREQCLADVLQFLEELRQNGMVLVA